MKRMCFLDWYEVFLVENDSDTVVSQHRLLRRAIAAAKKCQRSRVHNTVRIRTRENVGGNQFIHRVLNPDGSELAYTFE